MRQINPELGIKEKTDYGKSLDSLSERFEEAITKLKKGEINTPKMLDLVEGVYAIVRKIPGEEIGTFKRYFEKIQRQREEYWKLGGLL